MGYSTWSDDAYRSVSKARVGQSSAEIFRDAQAIDPTMQPWGLGVREARDSATHPESVPIIVAFDVTGSMGDIPTRFAQETLGDLMDLLVDRGYVTDPQILFAAIGDAVSDRAPLQVGQFESGIEMDMWLTKLWLEGGGGDEPESYLLAHWFAANHTACDHWEKRQKKGYLFTIGDATNKPITDAHIQRVFGTATGGPTADAAVIDAASETWECFHILVTRGKKPTGSLVRNWTNLMGSRLLVLDETEAICDLIGVTIGGLEGRLSGDDAKDTLTDAGMADWYVGPIVDRVT